MTDADFIRRFAEDYDDSADYAYLGDSDDDAWDDDSTENLARTMRRPLRFRSSPAVTGARVGGSSGPMPVRFQQPVASAQAIERLKQDTQKAIADVRSDIAKLRTDTDKRLKTISDRQASAQQNSMLTTLLPLLTPPPKVKSLTFPQGTEIKPGTALQPSVEFEPQDMTMMLLPLLLGGGLGGSGGSGQNDMMLLAVALIATQRR